jgi:hypothetical protein
MPDTYLDMSLFRPSGYENVTIADTATATQPTEEQLRAWTLGAVGPLTATRKMQLPLTRGYQATVANLTSGNQVLEVGGATGNVVVLAPNEVCTVVTDGVHYGRTMAGAAAPSRVQIVNVPITTYTDTLLTAEQAAAEVLIVTGGTDGGGYSLAFPDGFTRPDGDAIAIYEATGVGFSVILGGDTWNLPQWGTLLVRWFTGAPPTANSYTPLTPGGNTSQILLGNGAASNTVPAVTLPVPAANSKGGVALPPYPSGLQYQDWGGWGGPGVLVIALPDADGTMSLSNYSNGVMIFTGPLTADRTWIMPLISGRTWHVINLCTGAHSLLFRGSTGAAATVANGARSRIATDGLNYYA